MTEKHQESAATASTTSKRDPNEVLSQLLEGLGLASLGFSAARLQRHSRKQPKLYSRLCDTLKNLSPLVLRQTPATHIVYQEYRDGGSLHSLLEYPALCRFLAAPLDRKQIDSMWLGTEGADATASFNERLYKLVKQDKLEMRQDLTPHGGAVPPRCSQLVVMDSKAKRAYFCGGKAENEAMERVLGPLINYTPRDRKKEPDQDFGTTEAIKQVKTKRREAKELLKRMSKASSESGKRKGKRESKKDKNRRKAVKLAHKFKQQMQEDNEVEPEETKKRLRDEEQPVMVVLPTEQPEAPTQKKIRLIIDKPPSPQRVTATTATGC